METTGTTHKEEQSEVTGTNNNGDNTDTTPE